MRTLDNKKESPQKEPSLPMKHIVRLASLEISSIKNVRNGRIIMPHARRKQPSRRGEDLLGLYGSGKTAVVDVMYYLQKIMTGAGLSGDR